MLRVSPTAILGAALAASAILPSTATAQPEQTGTAPGLLPFRSPQQNVEAPLDLFRDLRLMSGLADNPGEFEVTYDEEGREVCSNPIWLRTREMIKGKMFNMAAMFGIILRDSRHGMDRRMAAYGAFYVDKVSDVFKLMAFFPGEPLRQVREEAFRRSIEFLRVHWPKNKEVDADAPVDPDYPPESLYKLEIGPYLALLDLDDTLDQAQGLWFLRNLCEIRADSAAVILANAEARLRSLLLSEDATVRSEARALLQAADPAHRDPPASDAAPEAIGDWLDAVVYDVFPPIRRVNKGRVDLYPSDDLDRLVAVGREALTNESIGGPMLGKLKNGAPFRGYQVQRLPTPLDKLRIPAESVITAIHGTPVATGADILRTLETLAKGRTVYLVEYVYGGKTHAMEYRLQR